MKPSLTVVLPVRNAELSLRRHVTEVLEMASELTPRFSVLVVDDASQDDTFDTAKELAAQYPQLKVLRNSRQRGLGPTLKSLRTIVKSDVVVVHDGTSSINADEIRSLWAESQARSRQGRGGGELTSQVTIDDLRVAASGHAAMAMAHSRLLGFHLLTNNDANLDLPRRSATREASVGTIPHLPRPNFLSSLANFALGE